MTEIVSCPECGRKLQVPPEYFGKTVQCPECQQQFTADPEGGGVQPLPRTSPPAAPSSAPRSRTYDDDLDDDHLPSSGRDDYRYERNYVPHRGGMILAFGIIALVLMPCSTIIFGPMAWIMGNGDLAQIRAGAMDPDGEGMTQAGRIIGMIATILMCLVVGFYCLIVMLMIATHH